MNHLSYRFGPYVLDLAKRELLKEGEVVSLPARVFKCLVYLIEHRDRAVHRDELAQAVFSRDDVSDTQLAQIILRSRRAVGDDGQEQYAIRTIPRYGFRWIADADQDAVVLSAASSPVATMDSARVEADLEGFDRLSHEAADADAAAPVRDGSLASWPSDEAALAGGDSGQKISLPRPRRRGRKRGFMLALLPILAMGAGFAAWTWKQDGHVSTPLPEGVQRAILVLPVRVQGTDDTAWARLGLMDYLADRMRRAGLPALSSDNTLSLLEASAAGHAAPDMAHLRQTARVEWIVDGEVGGSAGGWTVQLRATDAHGLAQHGRAQGSNLLDTARIAGDRLLAALGGKLPAQPGDDDPGLAERLQRAQAAMLANELDTARRILGEAPELQRAQPQLRYRLGQVDFRAGQYARSLATADALLDGAAAREDPLFRARLNILRGANLIRQDRYPESEQSYSAAIATLMRTGSPTELGNALTGRGVAKLSQDRSDEALEDLGLARVQLLRSGDALAVARVDANLGSIQLLRALPAQALGYYAKAARDFESLGAVNELISALGMLQATKLELLQAKEALTESDRAWALLPHLRDPAQRASVILERAEAFIANGRLAEAGQLLALPATAPVLPSEAKRRDVLRLELARQIGDPAAIMRQADAALAGWPLHQPAALHDWVRLHRMQAWRRLGSPAGTADRAPITGDGVAQILLHAVQADRPQEAEAAYRKALQLAGSRGVPREVKEAVIAYADWLLARGDAARAAGLLGQVMPWADGDFGLAVLQARVYARLGEEESWRASLDRARLLAGERRLPADGEISGPTGEMAGNSSQFTDFKEEKYDVMK